METAHSFVKFIPTNYFFNGIKKLFQEIFNNYLKAVRIYHAMFFVSCERPLMGYPITGETMRLGMSDSHGLKNTCFGSIFWLDLYCRFQP